MEKNVKNSSVISEKTAALNYAKHDMSLCSAPGLFRSLAPGARIKGKLNITYECGDERIQFKGPEPLGVTELRMLQGMIAMCGPHGMPIGPIPKTDIGKRLRDGMELTGEAEKESILGVVSQGYNNLATEIGYVSVKTNRIYDLMKESIKRLMTVTIFVKKGKKESGFHLISYYHSDDGSNDLNYALNPRISAGILSKRQFALLCMHEIRMLKTDGARILHQKLAWINYGRTGKVTIEVLREYIYPDDENKNQENLNLSEDELKKIKEKKLGLIRKRTERAKAAIQELVSIGWIFTEYSKGKFSITKPQKKEIK